MSAQTALHIYFEKKPKNPTLGLQLLLELAGSEQFFVWVREGEDSRNIKKAVPRAAIPGLLGADNILSIDAGKCPLGKKFKENVKSIPVEIRGENLLTEVHIIYGKHELRRWNYELEKAAKMAHPYGRLVLWGYETPSDWTQYSHDLAQLEIVRHLVAQMEPVVGKTEVYVSYSC